MGRTRWQEQVWEDAQAALPEAAWRYFTAGALDEVSLAESSTAWQDVRLSPRVLRDVRNPDASCTLLGCTSAFPLGIAPTSMQRLAHPAGEVAMAEAARDCGTVVVVSSNAGATFEQIGAAGATWWLQAYVTARRDLIAPALVGAASAGATAIVLTLDTPVPGPKHDVDLTALGDLTGVYGANHPDAVRGSTPGAEHAQDLTAHDIAWLTEVTGLPVVAKGVLRDDDARACVEAGAKAVWVSNHGGRQLDRAISTRDALPAVADAVGDAAQVYVDGGIRSGLDVVSALALGADAVFAGRLPLLALSAGGPDRVRSCLQHLQSEVAAAMRLAGCSTVADTRSLRAAPSLPTL